MLLTIIPLLLAACAVGQTPTPTPATAARPGIPILDREITVPDEGEVVLSLTASAPGTAWARLGAEAATISVHIDSRYKADVVLFRGETTFTYDVLVGALKRGTHRLSLRLEPSKSAGAANAVRVDNVAVQVYRPGDPLHPVMAHAPILYGREESRASDTPLFMYHEISRDGITTTIQYTLIFSNEDGGTAADGLMARWGRLTDIEWVYRVVLNDTGEIVREEFQDKDHNTAPFRGTKEDRHPILKDVTKNNLFADVGTSSYRFALAPVETLPAGSREEMMDRHPWMYQVMAEEWERESVERRDVSEKSSDPDTQAVSDPRNYLYVEFRAIPATSPTCDARLAIQAKLKGSDRWYSSDHGVDNLRIQNPGGWRRGTIELPPGTIASQVESLRLVIYPGKNQPGCALTLTDVRKLFFLGQDYVPGPSLLTWQGETVLDADEGTARPAQFLLPVAGRQ